MKTSFVLRLLIDGAGRLATLLIIILLARILTVEDFGKLTFALSYTGIVGHFADAGTHFAFLREMGRDSRWNRVWSEIFGLKLLLLLGAGFIGSILSLFVWPWAQPLVPIALLGYMIGNSLIDFFHQACNAADRVALSSVVTASHRGICLAVILAVVSKSRSLDAMAWALCLGSLGGAIGSFMLLRRWLRFIGVPAWNPPAWRHWVKSSLPLGLSGLFSTTYVRVGILMLPWLHYAQETGYYGAAQRLFEAGYMIPAALMAVTLPRLSRAFSASATAPQHEIQRIGLFVAGIACTTILIGQLLASPAIHAMFGDSYVASISILRVLILVTAFAIVNYFLATILIVCNRQVRHAIHEAISLGVTVLLTLVLVRQFGPAGATWALLCTEAVLFILTLIALKQAIPVAKEAPAPELSSHA